MQRVLQAFKPIERMIKAIERPQQQATEDMIDQVNRSKPTTSIS